MEHEDARSYEQTKIGKVMKAREAQLKTVSTDAEKVDVSDNLKFALGEKQNDDVSRQDLQRALKESRASEARLRKIIDTIPALAWCKISDGSNEFVNQRWGDYRGLFKAEG